MADFSDKLSALVSIEIAGGKVRDPAVMSEIMERLASSLAFTIALAAQGDAKGMNDLIEGMTSYIYETAAERAPLAKMITEWERSRDTEDQRTAAFGQVDPEADENTGA